MRQLFSGYFFKNSFGCWYIFTSLLKLTILDVSWLLRDNSDSCWRNSDRTYIYVVGCLNACTVVVRKVQRGRRYTSLARKGLKASWPKYIIDYRFIPEDSDWMHFKLWKMSSNLSHLNPNQLSTSLILAYLWCFHLLRIITPTTQLKNSVWATTPFLIRPLPAIGDWKVRHFENCPKS